MIELEGVTAVHQPALYHDSVGGGTRLIFRLELTVDQTHLGKLRIDEETECTGVVFRSAIDGIPLLLIA